MFWANDKAHTYSHNFIGWALSPGDAFALCEDGFYRHALHPISSHVGLLTSQEGLNLGPQVLLSA